MSKQAETLARDNEKLKAENQKLKAKLEHERQHHPLGRGWRLAAISFCIAAATASLIVGNVLFWTGDTLVNTDKYSQTISNVIKDDAVQAGIAKYTTDKLFETVDVSGVIQGALPPRASFLAAPLTTQVRGATNSALKNVLASDKFQTTFVKLNTNAHDRFINAVKNSKGDGKLNLQEVYDRLGQSLQNTKLSFLAGKSLPPKFAEITIVKVTWLPQARDIINAISWIKPVSLLFVAVFSAIAIWLARNRRKLVIVLFSFFSLGMFASLISYRITRSIVVSHAAPAYQTAVDHAARIIVQPLVLQTATILTVSLLVVVAAWLSGPYKTARAVRERIDVLLAGKLHQAIFGKNEPALTRWIGQRKRLLQWLAVGLVAVIMLFVTLSPGLIIKYAVLMLVLVLAIETLAAPQSKR